MSMDYEIQLERLLTALVLEEPLTWDDDYNETCTYCAGHRHSGIRDDGSTVYEFRHDQDCPWLCAREFVIANVKNGQLLREG